MQKTTALVSTRRAALLGSGCLVVSGCFGSFPLTNIIYDWNGGFGSKWVRWLIFLGLIIIPVYEIALIVDALILNTIEFWTGGGGGGGGGGSSESSTPSSVPSGGGSKRKRKSSDLGNGHRVAIESTENPDVFLLEHHVDGKLVRTLYLQRVGEHELRLFDDQHRLVAITRSNGQGGVELRDGRMALVAGLDQAQCSRVVQTARSGGSVAIAMHDELLRTDAAAPEKQEIARRQAETRIIF